MLSDSATLRKLLAGLFPGLVITGTPSPSGQRVVYFCHFTVSSKKGGMTEWGQVVLKVSEGISANQIAYLEKEIQILNSLKSPHYPKLLFNEAFTEDPATSEKLHKRLFTTIEERIEANPLRSHMQEYRTEKQLLLLLIGLVEALEPLWKHQLKLVHRDLKPENILIRPNGEVAIIDLGIIREEGKKGVTHSFVPYGPCTPHYASPEQARNDKRNITYKSDFFSIGILAYEILAQRLPFGDMDADTDTILQNVLELTPPTLYSLGKSSGPVSLLVERMMQKEPYQRHRTIEILKQELTDTFKNL